MAQLTDTTGTAAALDERLSTLNAELSRARELAVTAQVKAAIGGPGAQEEADRLDGEVQRLERAATATREALAAVGEAAATIAGEAEEASAKRAREALKRAGQSAREALKALDDATDALAAAYLVARERIAAMYLAADGPTRKSDEFDSLQVLVPSISAVLLSRLTFREDKIQIPNISAGVDREGLCPSVQERFEAVISTIAPGPGRPKKPGADPAPPPVAPDSSAGGATVASDDEAAARAAIEQDIAA